MDMNHHRSSLIHITKYIVMILWNYENGDQKLFRIFDSQGIIQSTR